MDRAQCPVPGLIATGAPRRRTQVDWAHRGRLQKHWGRNIGDRLVLGARFELVAGLVEKILVFAERIP